MKIPIVDGLSPSEFIREGHLRHVAIIMDGNRRWSKSRHLPGLLGHRQGVESLKSLVRHVGEIGLEALTVYAFSTENWQRSDDEVGYLMKLFVEALSAELEQLAQNNVQIRFIGDLSPLPEGLQTLIARSEKQTASNTGLRFQVATNYGGRYELIQAMRRLGQDIKDGTLAPDDVTESHIEQYLYTAGLSDPDLLIRTGGESRTSNFLMWQSAYTEFYVTETLWPDFDSAAFDRAVEDFASRQRRYGK